MDIIYLDNSATTCPSKASLEKMREALSVSYGNAGSVHVMGNAANKLLSEAREAVGLTLGIRRPQDGQVIFTSSGSEANNLAVFGSINIGVLCSAYINQLIGIIFYNSLNSST